MRPDAHSFDLLHSEMLPSVNSVEEDAAANNLGHDFDEHISIVSSLWNSEVAAILERELSRLRAEDPNEISSSYIQKSLKYVKKFSNYENIEAVEQAKKLFTRNDFGGEKYQDFSQFEVACINNLNIMSIEEALALVPSLHDLGSRISKRQQLSDNDSAIVDAEGLIQNLIDDLKRYQSA